jgi:diguanylate cyclase (GGDEF)-like protein
MKRAAALLSTGSVGAAVALSLVVLASPSTTVHRSALLLGAAAMAGAVWLSARWYDLDRRLTMCIALACAAFAARALLSTGTATTSAAALVFGVIGTVLLLAGITRLVRDRYDALPSGVLLDGVPLAVAAWLVGWILLVHPLLASDRASTAQAVLAGAFVPTTAVMLYLAVVLLGSHARRPMALVLVTAAVCLDLAGVVWRLAAAAHDFGGPTVNLADALFVASFFVGAAGFLHPSIAIVHRPNDGSNYQGPTSRLVVMTACLALPVLLTATTSPGDAVDRWMRGIATVVLIVAVVARIVDALGDIRRSHERLLRGAQLDPLTMLPNHHLLLVRINEALNDTWRTGTMPTVCFIDLDRFKNVNDKFGRAVGDDVLRVVARRLRGVVPEGAVVSRLAVDEYVVLDPSTTSVAAAEALAERLHQAFTEPLSVRDQHVFITASIGVAQASVATTATAHDLINHAETAKTRAQELGTNRVVIYADSMQEKVDRRLSLELALPAALGRQELHLAYQPILTLDGGAVVGFEALMRWTRPDGSAVTPAEFIPIAEQNGSIVSIGRWALLEALTQLRHWIDGGHCAPDATVSVNVSPRQLADDSFPAAVHEALQRSGMRGEHLWLEITESVMIADTELALATLHAVRQFGVRIALDDFGTGYSSLSLVQQFPLQRLKIDRHFVQGLVENADDRQLVQTIIAMGRSLGLDLVAEGVETIQQLRLLREFRCDMVQGYLISKPNPPEMIGTTVAGLHQGGLGVLFAASAV